MWPLHGPVKTVHHVSQLHRVTLEALGQSRFQRAVQERWCRQRRWTETSLDTHKSASSNKWRCGGESREGSWPTHRHPRRMFLHLVKKKEMQTKSESIQLFDSHTKLLVHLHHFPGFSSLTENCFLQSIAVLLHLGKAASSCGHSWDDCREKGPRTQNVANESTTTLTGSNLSETTSLRRLRL